MRKLMLCLAVLVTFTLGATAQEIAGQWQGVLKANKDLRIILKIAKDDSKLQATMYSIDQGSFSIKASGVRFEGGTLSLSLDLIGGKYVGKLSSDGKSLNGTWTQGPAALPLTLVRTTPETAWEIPAPPPPPKLMAPDADPSFEVATIKPNPSSDSGLRGLTMNGRNFRIRNGSLADLIGFAYDVQSKQIANAPEWFETDRYDIDALPDKEGDPSPAQLRVMVKKLLVERFQLKAHGDKREMPAFVLSEAKTGSKITPTQMNGPLPGFGMSPGQGGLRLNVMNGTLDEFCSFMQMIILDRPVVNHAELKGRFDFHVTFTPDDSQFHGHPPKLPPAADGGSAESAPNLFEAMQQQAGLRLSAEKAPVNIVVIDHVEKPSAN